MKLALAASILACAGVKALSDSSPFVLFSTTDFASIDEAQLQGSENVIGRAQEILSSCPTSRYLLLSQPNVHAGDIRDMSGCRMPNLCRAMGSDRIRGKYNVAEVIGQVSTKTLYEYIVKACADKGKKINITKAELRHLPPLKETLRRSELVADNDHEIGQLLEDMGHDFTVLIFSDPNEFQTYKSEFIEPVHMELKRQDGAVRIIERVDKNSTHNHPLFEKYQFFTPGLLTLLIILSILGVGLKALSSLEVSYGAFDKEMGPAAHKK